MTTGVGTTVTVEDVEVDTRHWIGGRRVASGSTFADVSPIDEQRIAEIAAGGAEEVDAAVSAARDAFPAWAGLDVAARAAGRRRGAAGIDARAEDRPGWRPATTARSCGRTGAASCRGWG